MLICEYVQAFKRRIIFELRNSCILQDEGFPHYVSDYDCGKHLRKEHGMGLAQESPSCFKRALSWSGVTMSFIATSGR